MYSIPSHAHKLASGCSGCGVGIVVVPFGHGVSGVPRFVFMLVFVFVPVVDVEFVLPEFLFELDDELRWL